MHEAEVQIADGDDFGALLRKMRLWLDKHHFEPSTFTYLDLNPGMSIQVSFKARDEAEIFAKQFGGSFKLGRPTSFLIGSQPRPRLVHEPTVLGLGSPQLGLTDSQPALRSPVEPRALNGLPRSRPKTTHSHRLAALKLGKPLTGSA